MYCSLNEHVDGYSFSGCNALFSVFTGFSGAPHAKRHWELYSTTNDSGHLALAFLKAIPVLGGIIALIHQIADSVFYSMNPFVQESPSIPKPLVELKPVDKTHLNKLSHLNLFADDKSKLSNPAEKNKLAYLDLGPATRFSKHKADQAIERASLAKQHRIKDNLAKFNAYVGTKTLDEVENKISGLLCSRKGPFSNIPQKPSATLLEILEAKGQTNPIKAHAIITQEWNNKNSALLGFPKEYFIEHLFPFLNPNTEKRVLASCKTLHLYFKELHKNKILEFIDIAKEIDSYLTTLDYPQLCGSNDGLLRPLTGDYIPFHFDIKAWTRAAKEMKKSSWHICKLDLLEALSEYNQRYPEGPKKSQLTKLIEKIEKEMEENSSDTKENKLLPMLSLCREAAEIVKGRLEISSFPHVYENPFTTDFAKIMHLRSSSSPNAPDVNIQNAPYVNIQMANAEHENWVGSTRRYRKARHMKQKIHVKHLIGLQTGDRFIIDPKNILVGTQNNVPLVILRCHQPKVHFQIKLKELLNQHSASIQIYGDKYGYGPATNRDFGANSYGKKLEEVARLIMLQQKSCTKTQTV